MTSLQKPKHRHWLVSEAQNIQPTVTGLMAHMWKITIMMGVVLTVAMEKLSA